MKTILGLMIALTALGSAHAQSRPGGNGPLPGDPGTGGGGPGPSYGGNGGFRPIIDMFKKKKNWGAAVRDDSGIIQVAYQFTSKKGAEDAAMTACLGKKRGQCTVIGSGNSVMFAVARGRDGHDYFGSQTIDINASKIAMSECRRKSSNCQLIALVGTALGPRDPSIVTPFLND